MGDVGIPLKNVQTVNYKDQLQNSYTKYTTFTDEVKYVLMQYVLVLHAQNKHYVYTTGPCGHATFVSDGTMVVVIVP